jgi:TPR repeat protein
LRWFRLAAEQNHAQAQYMLGLVKLLGVGGAEKNLKEGMAWIQKSAANDNVDAQNMLASLYLQAKDVPRDPAAGVAWLERAAQQGSLTAQKNLGFVYRKGN